MNLVLSLTLTLKLRIKKTKHMSSLTTVLFFPLFLFIDLNIKSFRECVPDLTNLGRHSCKSFRRLTERYLSRLFLLTENNFTNRELFLVHYDI